MLDETKKEEVNETPVVDEIKDGGDESAVDGDTLTPSNDGDEIPGQPDEHGTEQNDEDSNGSDEDKVVIEKETPPVATEKMLTQSQVNELVGKARQEGRESALRDLLTRYGVNDDKELDVIFGKGQTYDDLNDDYSTQGVSLKEVSAENALLKSRIAEERWDDVKLILGGKGLDVNTENIETLLPSHPEWRKNETIGNEPKIVSPKDVENMVDKIGTKEEKESPTVLRKLGNGITEKPEESEEAQFKKLFGL